MSVFVNRSEEMVLCQLYLQPESAYYCISELGEIGLVQMRDLNPDLNLFKRKFVSEIRRCEEMERKLRFMKKEIEKEAITFDDCTVIPEAPALKDIIETESELDRLEKDLCNSNSSFEALKRSHAELIELKHLLRKTHVFFDEAEALTQVLGHEEPAGSYGEAIPLLEEPRAGDSFKLGFVAGLINRERLPVFERLLWRACRGNVFFKQAEIEHYTEDPATGERVHKSVFMVFFQGEQLRVKVLKICEGFKSTLYPCPENASERREMAMGLVSRLEDLMMVINQTYEHRYQLLKMMARHWQSWNVKVTKMKAIYHTINMLNFDVTRKCLIAEGWCAVADLDKIQNALMRGTEKSGASVPSIINRVPTSLIPPTFHRTNKFTQGFQNLVDAYGVAKYQEVNPALYSYITFPFLFSVMFGDCGHGLLMAIFAAWMVWNEKRLQFLQNHEMLSFMYYGRYIILLMGLFSIYAGVLYNDCFSKSLNLFGSSWVNGDRAENELMLNSIKKHPESSYDLNTTKHYLGKPYLLGVDPIWLLAQNRIIFVNSFKMKMSIVFGVIHMTCGCMLSLLNHRFFKRPVDIVGRFLPEIIFMLSIFGYLVFIIIFKWLLVDMDSHTKPSLLLVLINMFLSFSSPVSTDDTLFAGQTVIQHILVVSALLCVPWMLAYKPLMIWWNSGRNSQYQRQVDSKSDESLHGEEEEEADWKEVLVHQSIHAIEYCLGCISSTASYLRLWALSLAHTQLSEVLWSMVFRIGFRMEGKLGFIMIYIVFSVWAILTVGVLLVMEGLSAFLHTLRLHWVEFQNKFYAGSGIAFVPFSFQKILADGTS